MNRGNTEKSGTKHAEFPAGFHRPLQFYVSLQSSGLSHGYPCNKGCQAVTTFSHLPALTMASTSSSVMSPLYRDTFSLRLLFPCTSSLAFSPTKTWDTAGHQHGSNTRTFKQAPLASVTGLPQDMDTSCFSLARAATAQGIFTLISGAAQPPPNTAGLKNSIHTHSLQRYLHPMSFLGSHRGTK